MSIRQLSVFAENKNGSLYETTKILADAEIEIRAFSVADTQSYGVLRLIVNDPKAAAAALSEAGKIVTVTDVIAVKIPDSKGGLSDLLRIANEKNISIEYLYAFVSRNAGSAYVVIKVADNAAVEMIFASEGYEHLEEADLH